MAVFISTVGKSTIDLMYSSVNFVEGLTVTGYLIYPDLTKSSVVTFDELGDGIYWGCLPNKHKANKPVVRYGVVIKENGVITKFDFLSISV